MNLYCTRVHQSNLKAKLVKEIPKATTDLLKASRE